MLRQNNSMSAIARAGASAGVPALGNRAGSLGGGGFDWGKVFGGVTAGAPLGPMGMLGGGLISAIGAGIDAHEDRAFQKSEAARDQKNKNRAFGFNALDLMNNNYVQALHRSMAGY